MADHDPDHDHEGEIEHALHVPLEPRGAALVLCHGANNDYSAPLLVQAAGGAAMAGLYALRFNFAFRSDGTAASAETMPQSVADILSGVGYMRHQLGVRRLYMAGKSYGARAVLETVRQGQRASGVVFWGLPLTRPGKPADPATLARVRETLAQAGMPALFVAGSHDPICPPDAARRALDGLEGASLYVVEGGDHSYRPVEGCTRTGDELVAEAARAAVDWILARETGAGPARPPAGPAVESSREENS